MNPKDETTVVLTRPHTHAGRHYPAGGQLAVDPGVAGWLIAQGIAHQGTKEQPGPQTQADVSAAPATTTSTSLKPPTRKESRS